MKTCLAVGTALVLCAEGVFMGVAAADSGSPPLAMQSAAGASAIHAYDKVGEATFRAFVFRIYDAELFADGKAFSWAAPFALKLTYARDIESRQIVDASLEEMARISGRSFAAVESYRPMLSECFPDVREGDEIVGHAVSEYEAEFFYNGRLTCRARFDGGNIQFFGIWLGEDTLDPEKSLKLRGLS